MLLYNEIDMQQWQSLIDQSPTATWFQTPEAYRFYASLPDEMTPFVVGVCEVKDYRLEVKGKENGEAETIAYNLSPITYNLTSAPANCQSPIARLKGVCVGYITKEKNSIKQFFTRRAIIIGGPLLSEDASNEEVETLLKAVTNAYRQWPIANRPIYIETRNFHDYSKWKSIFEQTGFAYQPHYDIYVYCNEQHRMSEQRMRQVKKAIKNGAEICKATSEQEIHDWYQILCQLYRQKVRTPLFSETFFLEFYRQGWGKYLLVKHQGKVIGGMMCPIFANKAIYEWYVCGLDERYKEQYPSVMVTYAAIEYAKANGIAIFDFMGAGKPNVPYGVRDFKMEFGGELVEHGRFLCVRKPLLYWIGKMGVKILKNRKIW